MSSVLMVGSSKTEWGLLGYSAVLRSVPEFQSNCFSCNNIYHTPKKELEICRPRQMNLLSDVRTWDKWELQGELVSYSSKSVSRLGWPIQVPWFKPPMQQNAVVENQDMYQCIKRRRLLTFAMNSPSWMCASVPHTPQAFTLIKTSLSRSLGSGTVTTENSFGFVYLCMKCKFYANASWPRQYR